MAIASFSLLACDSRSALPVFSEAERALVTSLVLGRHHRAPSPDGLTALGHALFFDNGISGSGDLSCASCHDPKRYFTDGRRTALGRGKGRRNTPTLLGAAEFPFLGWDGAADSQWSQALAPLESRLEMDGNRAAIVHAIGARYRSEYEALFGPLPELRDSARFPAHARPLPGQPEHPHARAWMSMQKDDRDDVNRAFSNIGRALAAYQQQLVTKPSAFDRFAWELASSTSPSTRNLTASAQAGLLTFIGSGACINCHNGDHLSDRGFHNLGLPNQDKDLPPDQGHSAGSRKLLNSLFREDRKYGSNPKDRDMRFYRSDPAEGRGSFKTPSLRNVARTAPYGHDGQMETLEDMLGFYTRRSVKPATGKRDGSLVPLEPKAIPDLIAFLESLTGDLPDDRWLHPPGGNPEESTPEDSSETCTSKQ